ADPATQADDIDGEPLAPMRRARAFAGADTPPTVPPTSALGSRCSELWIVERHGYRGWTIPKADPDRALLGLRHAEGFRRRTRDFDDDARGFEHLNRLVDAAIADLGPDLACDLFF